MEVPSVENPGHRYLCERKVGIPKREPIQTTVDKHGTGLWFCEHGRDEARSRGGVRCRACLATWECVPTLAESQNGVGKDGMYLPDPFSFSIGV